MGGRSASERTGPRPITNRVGRSRNLERRVNPHSKHSQGSQHPQPQAHTASMAERSQQRPRGNAPPVHSSGGQVHAGNHCEQAHDHLHHARHADGGGQTGGPRHRAQAGPRAGRPTRLRPRRLQLADVDVVAAGGGFGENRRRAAQGGPLPSGLRVSTGGGEDVGGEGGGPRGGGRGRRLFFKDNQRKRVCARG